MLIFINKGVVAMTEMQIWNIMQMGLISNAMYFVGLVLLTWLGFRFAAKMRETQDADLLGKVMVSLFYVLIGLSFFNVNMIAGNIIMGSADAMAALADRSAMADNFVSDMSQSSLNPGGPLTIVFSLLPMVMQLLMTWGKAPSK